MPDRDYRNLQFTSVTRLATDFGNGSLNLAYMDHPYGADQFYGNFNSWEDTKTWFAGVQQALGDRKSTRLNSSHLGISYAVFCLHKQQHTSELQPLWHLVCRFVLERRSPQLS